LKSQAELLDEIRELRQAAKDDNDSDQRVVTRLDKAVADYKAGAIDGDALSAALTEVRNEIKGVTSTQDTGEPVVIPPESGGTLPAPGTPGETDVPIPPNARRGDGTLGQGR
jgi:hypothetical protein